MKLSRKSEYAFRALMCMALQNGQTVRLADLSRAERIPCRFLERILRDLTSAGILRSKRGVGGGYELNKPPHLITLGEILRCMDGPILSLWCADGHEGAKHSCQRHTMCGLRPLMLEAIGGMTSVLDRTTLESVCLLTHRLEAAAGVHTPGE